MILLNNISQSDAVRIFADYCSQSSTPEDIFDFDGEIPRARLKYCPLMVYYAEYFYNALVEITTENEVHSKSSLGYDTTQYRNNIRQSDSGFFSSMYEDYSDTRYSDTTIVQKYMDRSTGDGNFAVFASTGQIDTVDEKLWPSEDLDSSLLIPDEDNCKIRSNPLVSQAVDFCLENLDTSDAEPPYEKIEYVINRDINNALRNRYSKCNFEIKDIDYTLDSDSQNVSLLLFPYYEFSFTYNRLPYFVYIAAHNQAEASTGLFGGSKDVVTGNLPSCEKMPGGLFSKISNKRKIKLKKKEEKINFLNTIGNNISFTA